MLLNQQQLTKVSDKVHATVTCEDGQYWLDDGSDRVALFPWRQNMRLNNMRKKVQDGTIHDISVIKSECTDQRCFPILKLAMREFDICEWLLDEKIGQLFAQTDNKHAFHLIGRFEGGARCSLDISNGLNEGTRETNRHEIISSVGNLTDLPVGMQYASEDIYAFRSDDPVPDTYMEVIIEDEFYTREEAQLIRDANSLKGNADEIQKRMRQYAHIRMLAEKALQSSEQVCPVEVSL